MNKPRQQFSILHCALCIALVAVPALATDPDADAEYRDARLFENQNP